MSREEEDGTDEDAFCIIQYKFERDNFLNNGESHRFYTDDTTVIVMTTDRILYFLWLYIMKVMENIVASYASYDKIKIMTIQNW